ncbi:MAG: DUF4386 domain-containing protein, partial [Pseudomonadota bacterium]
MSAVQTARTAGLALLASIGVGIVTAIFVAKGIDINLNSNVEATAQAMLEAEQRLKAKSYIDLLTFALEVLFSLAMFQLVKTHGRLLAGWSLLTGLAASVLVLMGAVFSMNAAQIAGNTFYQQENFNNVRLLVTSLQATSDYTSFHLSLVLSSAAKAGFFYLLFIARLIPRLLSGWGVFASLLVASVVVSRDFMPVLGSDIVTAAFILSNLIALLATGLYLSIRGIPLPAQGNG